MIVWILLVLLVISFYCVHACASVGMNRRVYVRAYMCARMCVCVCARALVCSYARRSSLPMHSTGRAAVPPQQSPSYAHQETPESR
jgi:hypothetical protein